MYILTDEMCFFFCSVSLKHQEEGAFRDVDLVRMLRDTTGNPDVAFKVCGLPGLMHLNDMMGMDSEQAGGGAFARLMILGRS